MSQLNGGKKDHYVGGIKMKMSMLTEQGKFLKSTFGYSTLKNFLFFAVRM